MAQSIVHILEFIEIEHRDSHLILIPLGLGQGDTEAIGEELPVGKTRQGIMVGHLLDLFLRPLAFTDVADALDRAYHVARLIVQR